MEWCDGPSLGDLVRAGQGARASEIFCDAIRSLQAAALAPQLLEPLATSFAPLIGTLRTGDLAPAADLVFRPDRIAYLADRFAKMLG
jgi:hypothetical protein